MKYEVVRFYDSSRFRGHAVIACVEADTLPRVGDAFEPRPEECDGKIDREIKTGVISHIVQLTDGAVDYRMALEGVIDVSELSNRYGISEDTILSTCLGLSSRGRDQLLSKHGGVRLLDDIVHTADKGTVGVLWIAQGPFLLYDYETGQVLHEWNPGLGANYGRIGANDFLGAIHEASERSGKKNLVFDAVLQAIDAIGDWDHYHHSES